MPGAFEPAAGTPDFREVSVASGKVVYPLQPTNAPGRPPGAVRGVLVVQMLDDIRIRVETFAGPTAADPSFTGGAKIYRR